MTDQPIHPGEAGLPTLSKLGISSKSLVESVDPLPIAEQWLSSFASSTAQASLNIPSLTGDTEPSVYWRDVLALTWDFRTFEGTQKIQKFLEDRLAGANIRNVKLDQADGPPAIASLFPDILWLQLFFTFDTDVGGCTAIARLVPVVDKEGPGAGNIKWTAHTVFTRLESLHDVPELLGLLRKQEPFHGPWDEARAEEIAFKERDPTVLIIGAGQGGLMTAANLKVLGVDSLIIEKTERVGDNWRKRYEALCLHDPVWYDHFPFIPFPKTWPIYTPARKLGNWLESYVDALDLNVWTSSTVTKVERGQGDRWAVTVVSSGPGGDRTRVFNVRHVVFASGWIGMKSYVPDIPGRDKFRGQVLHSFEHNRATDHSGKKVVVVGACTAAFDISVDYVEKGVDVTMYQRKSSYIISGQGLRALLAGLYSENTPFSIEVADRLNLSMPNLFMAGVNHRSRQMLAELDKDIIEGLEKKGFHVNTGYRDTGILFQVWQTGGGYYIDVGGSKYIIDGRLKVKGDCGAIKEYTEKGLRFEDGSELDADVVVFCTGLDKKKHPLSDFLAEDVITQCSPLWGLDDEGELKGVHREVGPRGLWSMMGNLAVCRMNSKHLALQIKAMEKGCFGTRYSKGPGTGGLKRKSMDEDASEAEKIRQLEERMALFEGA
ncbi:hypothetical protein DFP72DRAFT_1098832 [Ephemerocybe angulata]|uniref:Flavin-containing monooxygenase n=1 Tax=Ephemerocybe angulata TaxID=980116 RepID=A0A8H6MBG6_9AGAR|nr:hypothetical protein DFP72DRAFT_1098832 [Tulosesus angulatus]